MIGLYQQAYLAAYYNHLDKYINKPAFIEMGTKFWDHLRKEIEENYVLRSQRVAAQDQKNYFYGVEFRINPWLQPLRVRAG